MRKTYEKEPVALEETTLHVVWIPSVVRIQTAQEITFVDIEIFKSSITNCISGSKRRQSGISRVILKRYDEPIIIPVDFDRTQKPSAYIVLETAIISGLWPQPVTRVVGVIQPVSDFSLDTAIIVITGRVSTSLQLYMSNRSKGFGFRRAWDVPQKHMHPVFLSQEALRAQWFAVISWQGSWIRRSYDLACKKMSPINVSRW